MKLILFAFLVYTTFSIEDAEGHAIDTAKILSATKKLNVLAAMCKSCFAEEIHKKNATTEEDKSEDATPNLTIGEGAEQIFRGIGKIALNKEEEMFDEEGTPIDAEVTIVVKLNKNSNHTVIMKKLLLDNLEDFQIGLGGNQ